MSREAKGENLLLSLSHHVAPSPSAPPGSLDLFQVAKTLRESRDALQQFENSALAAIAASIAQTAESLAKTARELREIAPDEWLTFEEAAAYLKKTPKAFEKVVAQGEIPKHYLTERGILFSRKELDEWLLSR
ncbi:helix-turn-helix domain-containing protein [Rubrobacter calidifluminis]|uniref:helix-turn-helix domain-containing protein n=1 Tax=Rubrobacter calidifluminis TaxID=1392640 RepID=UPI00236180FF|nr:helix-turn-helix domain-containing protein [Rubrobacter calidifluminis]